MRLFSRTAAVTDLTLEQAQADVDQIIRSNAEKQAQIATRRANLERDQRAFSDGVADGSLDEAGISKASMAIAAQRISIEALESAITSTTPLVEARRNLTLAQVREYRRQADASDTAAAAIESAALPL